MARASWKNPPPAVIVAGNEHFLREREVRKAVLTAARLKRQVVWATTDGEVVDSLTMAVTFGEAMLVVAPLKEVEPSTIKEAVANPAPDTCVLLVYDGPLTDSGIPAAAEVNESFKVQFLVPKKRKDLHDQAVKFLKNEAEALLDNESALDTKLAEAIVKAAGSDIGTLAHEILKIAAYVRAKKQRVIEPEHVRALLRVSTEVDLEPLRDALRNRNGSKVAQEMDRLRRNADKDPLMLLLRAKGGVADLAMSWYRTALLLERGATPSEIAGRMGVPEWIVDKDLVPAARRWGANRLRDLIENLAIADRGVQLGAPSPIASCEAALLLGCL